MENTDLTFWMVVGKPQLRVLLIENSETFIKKKKKKSSWQSSKENQGIAKKKKKGEYTDVP